MNKRKWAFSILLIVLFFLGPSSWSQIFIPFSFWRAPAGNLQISDGATYNYGSIAINSPTDYTFTVTNSSNTPAWSISGGAFGTTRFSFKGGAYPGTGGTCTNFLAASASCTIVVTANSTTAATFNDTITINYQTPTAMVATTRPVTAQFVSTPTNLAWINTPSFIKVNTCTLVTIQSQDSAGNPVNVAANTTVNLVINNATNTNFFTSNTCGTTTTTRTITAGTNSVNVYIRSTTADQNIIIVGSATGLTAASKNVIISNNPTRLLLVTPPRAKINTCTQIDVFTMDTNGYYSTVAANLTVNLATTGSNVFYSNSNCTTSVTTTTVLANTYQTTLYIRNATIETVTMTITATGYSSSNDTTNFATSLTWWNTSWSKRIRIEMNNLDQATAFTNQPVLVTIDSTRIDYAYTKTAGADIRFVASDDTTQIEHEIEKWDALGTSQIWVRVPSIPASAATEYIYMYYDNSAANDGQNRSGIWLNYWGVWHLNENPSSAAPQYNDSTTGNRNGTALNSPLRITGAIGNAVDLPATNDAIDVNSNLTTVIGATSTFSAWMKTTQTGNNTMWLAPGLTGVEQAGGGNDIFFGWIDGTGRIGVTAGNGADARSGFVVNNNAWRHVTISRNSVSGQVRFYINGVLQNTANSETGDKTTYFDLFGEIGDTGGSPTNYNGAIDEIRIRASVATDAQVEADFKYMIVTHLIYSPYETYP